MFIKTVDFEPKQQLVDTKTKETWELESHKNEITRMNTRNSNCNYTSNQFTQQIHYCAHMDIRTMLSIQLIKP